MAKDKTFGTKNFGITFRARSVEMPKTLHGNMAMLMAIIRSTIEETYI